MDASLALNYLEPPRPQPPALGSTSLGRRLSPRVVPPYIAVVGHGPLLERKEGAAMVLRQLGATVRTLDLWENPLSLLRPEDDSAGTRARVLLFEGLDRPDLALLALGVVRKNPLFNPVGALVALSVGQLMRLEPTSGFDDFVLHPYVPEELYSRIRRVEWRRSEVSVQEKYRIGAILLNRSSHEVTLHGAKVALTAKEFQLLAHLCEQRGRVVSRQQLLARVWGPHYEGGSRTVDIHIRRLRAKLGNDLPLETLRGSGYKLRPPPSESGDGT